MSDKKLEPEEITLESLGVKIVIKNNRESVGKTIVKIKGFECGEVWMLSADVVSLLRGHLKTIVMSKSKEPLLP